jgi:hypothetical protein
LVELLYTNGGFDAFARNPLKDRAMAKPRQSLTPEQTEQARLLAQDIRDQAAEIADEVASLLFSVPDEQLFGDTEFRIRDQVLKLVARSIAARLDQKKTATPEPASTAPVAARPPDSTATARAIP